MSITKKCEVCGKPHCLTNMKLSGNYHGAIWLCKTCLEEFNNIFNKDKGSE